TRLTARCSRAIAPCGYCWQTAQAQRCGLCCWSAISASPAARAEVGQADCMGKRSTYSRQMAYGAGPTSYSGTYSLGWGDTVTFHLNQDLGGRKVHAEKIVIDSDKLTMTDTDGTQVTFQKEK